MFHGFYLAAPFKLSSLELITLFLHLSLSLISISQCLHSVIRHKQPTTLLCVNSLLDVVRSSQIDAFADDTKVFKETTSTRDAQQLQEDLSDLVKWSDSSSLNFNYSKCKAQRITRKLKPVIFVYHMAGSQVQKLTLLRRILVFTSLITSLGISKSMCNALKGQQAPGICTERHQTRQKHYG